MVASSCSAAGGTQHVQMPHRLPPALRLQAEYVLGKWSGGEEAQQEADKVQVGAVHAPCARIAGARVGLGWMASCLGRWLPQALLLCCCMLIVCLQLSPPHGTHTPCSAPCTTD